jgi:cobalt/nickel transport system permease protein
MGGLLGTLLLRSYDRAERVYAAMKCRGFQGASYPVTRRRLTPKDCLLGLAVGGAIVFFRLVSLSRLLGGLAA